MTDEEVRERYIASAHRLWKKARINAFAHRAESDRGEFWGGLFSVLSIVFGISSVLSVLLAYIIFQDASNNSGEAVFLMLEDIFGAIYSDANFFYFEQTEESKIIVKSYFALLFTLLSVFFSIFSLITTIFGRSGRYDAKAEKHDFLQSLYLEIAQSCGPLKKDSYNLSLKRFQKRIQELEYRFKIVKMRGSEPSNRMFKKAHKIFLNRNVPDENDSPNGMAFKLRVYFNQRLDKLLGLERPKNQP